MPYEVKVQVFNYGVETVETLYQIDLDGYISTIEGDELKYTYKPYLFPLSSMTEEQKRNLTSLFNCHVEITQYEIKFAGYQDSNVNNWNKVFNWCYKHHVDVNSLIPMNLAIDATGLNGY